MSQQSLPLLTLTPMPEYSSLIPQPNFLLNFPVLYQSPNNPLCSSQGHSHDAQSNPEEPNLANAIHKFAQTVWENHGSGNRSKVWELDVFDGSDTGKLLAFLVQCWLNFNSKPWVFWTDASRVIHDILSQGYHVRLVWTQPHEWWSSGLDLQLFQVHLQAQMQLWTSWPQKRCREQAWSSLDEGQSMDGKVSCWLQLPCSLSHLGWLHSLTPTLQGTSKLDQGQSFPDQKTFNTLWNAPINPMNWCVLLGASIQNFPGILEVQ